MTDEQIVKALECCLSSNDLIACWKCPAVKLNICCDGSSKISNGIVNKVVDLIKRQQAEIENLREDTKKVRAETAWDITTEYEAYKEAVEVALVETRAEAVREFAEKLTNIICEKIVKSIDNLNGDDYYITDVYTDIDNLVKEMTEKEGGKG